MAQGRLIPHHGEAIVLRTWPFHEADLLVSLLTREQGVVKGVARHAMRSRRRFGGSLEPGTHVIAHYMERPREDLVRLDSFEILWSPMSAPVDALRLAGMQLVLEVLEQALPELAPEDNVFRLALAVLRAMGKEPRSRFVGSSEEGQGANGGDASVWLAVTYFCLWMNRLMGWWPELAACAVCGLDLRGQAVWWSPAADGATCADDRRPNSQALSAASVAESYAILRSSLAQTLARCKRSCEAHARQFAGAPDTGGPPCTDLRRFAIGVLERHLERRLRSANGLR